MTYDYDSLIYYFNDYNNYYNKKFRKIYQSNNIFRYFTDF